MRLQRTWLLLGLLCVPALATGFIVLRSAWGQLFAAQWALQAGVVLAYLFWWLGRNLSFNHAPADDALRTSLGWGNYLSLFRGLCIAILAGFLFMPRPNGWMAWAPMAVYTLGDLADYFDGYLARITDHATVLGEKLDLELDALGLLAAVVLAIGYATLPWWFLPVGLARYGFVLGLRLRERRGQTNVELPDSAGRRPIAGLTMGFMSAMLWPIVSPPATIMAGVIFVFPFGASFIRDWLVVSGRLDPKSATYRRALDLGRSLVLGWAPLPLRVAIALSVLPEALRMISGLENEAALYAAAGYSWPEGVVASFAAIQIAGLILIGLGAAGRFAAFAMVFPVGLSITALGLSENRTVALAAVLLILILGTGRLSLWKPSEFIFRRRTGGPGGWAERE